MNCTVCTARRGRSNYVTANHFPKNVLLQQCCNAPLTSYASLDHLTDINTRISTSELTLKITFQWMHEWWSAQQGTEDDRRKWSMSTASGKHPPLVHAHNTRRRRQVRTQQADTTKHLSSILKRTITPLWRYMLVCNICLKEQNRVSFYVRHVWQRVHVLLCTTEEGTIGVKMYCWFENSVPCALYVQEFAPFSFPCSSLLTEWMSCVC